MNSDPNPEVLRLTDVRTIVISALLVGPVGAAVLIARNCRNLTNRQGARKILVNSFLYVIAIIIFTALVEESFWILLVIPINCFVAWLSTEAVQGKALEEHFEAGGERYPTLNNILLVLIGTAVSLAIIYALYLVYILMDNFLWS